MEEGSRIAAFGTNNNFFSHGRALFIILVNSGLIAAMVDSIVQDR